MTRSHPPPPVPPSRGMTLVELCVVLAVVALLIVSVAPYTGTWSDNSRIAQTRSALRAGYAMTKALALQNPAQQNMGAVAAILCYGSGTVRVYPSGSCTGNASWQASLPTGVSVTLGGGTTPAASGCIALTNAGLPIAGGGATACSTSLQFSISKGSAYALQGTLY